MYTGGGRGHLLRRKVDRGGSILHSEKGPGVTFAIFLTFRGGGGGGGGIFNGEKLTGGGGGGGSIFNGLIFLTFRGGHLPRRKVDLGVHFQRVKMDRGVHFQRVKMDRGVHFQRVKMDRGVHFQRRKMDRGGPFYTGGGPFSTVENGPGGTFLGGSIFNLTPASNLRNMAYR